MICLNWKIKCKVKAGAYVDCDKGNQDLNSGGGGEMSPHGHIHGDVYWMIKIQI